jgi:serine protease Do
MRTDTWPATSYEPPQAGDAARQPPALGDDLAAVADHLRRVTVEVRAGAHGAGSGVVWRPDGLIVTNAHVARSDRASVTLTDGHVFDARVVARDDRRDLAALAIPAVALAAATPGYPAALRVGEMVLAMGHPLGISGALAMGIVHAVTARPGRGPRWIFADVRLAPGNSGGPLADARGRIIGINSMIVNGMGLAIPTNVIERFLRERIDPRVASAEVA